MKNRNAQQQHQGANRESTANDQSVGQADTDMSKTSADLSDTTADMMDEDTPM